MLIRKRSTVKRHQTSPRKDQSDVEQSKETPNEKAGVDYVGAMESLHFRGLQYGLLYYILHDVIIYGSTSTIGSSPSAQLTTYVLVAMLLAPLHMLWIQQVAVDKPFTPSFTINGLIRSVQALVVPSGVAALLRGLVIHQNVWMANWLIETYFTDEKPMPSAWEIFLVIVLSVFIAPLTAVFLNLAISMPAMTVITRIEVALLSSDVKLLFPVNHNGMIKPLDQEMEHESQLALLLRYVTTLTMTDWWLTAQHYGGSIFVIAGQTLPFINK